MLLPLLLLLLLLHLTALPAALESALPIHSFNASMTDAVYRFVHAQMLLLHSQDVSSRENLKCLW